MTWMMSLNMNTSVSWCTSLLGHQPSAGPSLTRICPSDFSVCAASIEASPQGKSHFCTAFPAKAHVDRCSLHAVHSISVLTPHVKATGEATAHPTRCHLHFRRLRTEFKWPIIDRHLESRKLLQHVTAPCSNYSDHKLQLQLSKLCLVSEKCWLRHQFALGVRVTELDLEPNKARRSSSAAVLQCNMMQERQNSKACQIHRIFAGVKVSEFPIELVRSSVSDWAQSNVCTWGESTAFRYIISMKMPWFGTDPLSGPRLIR